MTVDTIPHHLPHEAANLLEAFGAIELDHADGHFIATGFADEISLAVFEVWLSGAGANAGIPLQSFHECFEITRGDVQVEIEFADVFEIAGVDRFVAGVEGINHSRANRAPTAIGAADDSDVREFLRVLFENFRGLVR